MKTSGDEPAYPVIDNTGMTIRQKFVLAAMQGLLSAINTNGIATGKIKIDYASLSQGAVNLADVCLAEEFKTRKNELVDYEKEVKE